MRQKKKAKSPSVRKGIRRTVVCALCGKPISKAQSPSVQLQPGKQAHMECFIQHEQDAGKPN